MHKLQTFVGVASDEHLTAFPARGGQGTQTEPTAERETSPDFGKKTRVRVAVIYALTTIIPLLVMFYIIQANLFLRSSMGVASVSILALIALGIALLGGKIMKEVWGKVGQTVDKIEQLRRDGDLFSSAIKLQSADEIDRIPSVVTHLVEVAKKQMKELKAYNEQVQVLNSSLREANEKLHQLSREDALTGLHNRRYFDERAQHEIARTRRFGRDLALIIVDIDFFKHYNDSIGHPAGDKALAAIGAIIRKSIRETDLPFRYGGEELAIILPETTAESATAVAERIRSAVEKNAFQGESSQPNGSLTVSVGVSTLGKDCGSLEEFVSAADKALYKAKSVGRNRVVALSAD